MKILTGLVFPLGFIFSIVAFYWIYTTLQLAHARPDGIYTSSEEGMLGQIPSMEASLTSGR